MKLIKLYRIYLGSFNPIQPPAIHSAPLDRGGQSSWSPTYNLNLR